MIYFLLVFLNLISACNTDDDSNTSLPAENPICFSIGEDFPELLNLPPLGDNGSYDPTLASDPVTERVWMVFSRVNGPGGIGKVSTHLSYSDDHGNTWCYVNEINPSNNVPLSDLPDEFKSTAKSAHWSHEVPSIAYVSNAPNSERWQMTWHRYLHVDDGINGNDDRQFAYGWISMKKAASPELLSEATEIKLFSALGYYKDKSTEAFNDSILGLPIIKLHELHPQLSNAVVLTESGMHVFNNELYLSLLKGTLGGNDIVLVKRNVSGLWEYVNTLLKPEDALALNQSFTGFSATDLFSFQGRSFLLVSPVSELYEGLVMYELDVNTATLKDLDGNGPDVVLSIPKTQGPDIFQSGVGTYDELSYNSGILYGDAVVDSPQFRIYASGFLPEE